MKTPPKPTLTQLEERAREIGQLLGSAMPASSGYGFALLLFNFGDKGHLTYVSNAKRADMIEGLKELLMRLETQTTAPPGQPNHPHNKRNEG